MKIILCAVLLLFICFVPAGRIPEAPVMPGGAEITISIRGEFVEVPDSLKTPEDAFILMQGISCDPDILISVEPVNDPAFELEPESKTQIYIVIDPPREVPEG